MADAIFGTTDAGDSDLRAQLKYAQRAAREALRQEYAVALDYIEGRQFDDMRQQLLERFPSSQLGDRGQEIYPVCIPLVERFVAESANAYNRSVTRTLTREDGSEDDATKEQSANYARALEDCAYDEKMHQNERHTVGLGTGVVWHQAKRGMLCPTVLLPQDVYEVMDQDATGKDYGDPDDYLGYVVELSGGYGGDVFSDSAGRSFVFCGKDRLVFYRGVEPWEPRSGFVYSPNVYKWPQPTETGTIVEQPGHMLTFWNNRLSSDGAISKPEPLLVAANREINIVWSVLFDQLRFQGGAIPVKNLANPSDVKAVQRHGIRFPVVLGLEESFNYVSAATNYTDQIEALKQFVKLLAISCRLSPNDFAIEGQYAASGFAKLIESLPKLEARQERIRRLKHMEEKCAWPRNAAILRTVGRLSPESAQMRCRVQFADVEFPSTIGEEKQRADFEVQYNQTTPAKMLAHKLGVSVEEAEAVLEENKAKNAEYQEQPQQPAGAFSFGGRIGQRTKGAQ